MELGDGEWVRRRSEPKEGRVRQFVTKYRFELVWVGLVLLGLFLLFEPFNLREMVWAWARNAAHHLLAHLTRLDDAISGMLTRISPSDAVGLGLIIASAVAIVLRTRWRLLTDKRYTALVCPRCGGSIHRVHRKRVDRWINAYVPVRRYRCADSRCRWEGLRTGASRHGSSPPNHMHAMDEESA